MSNLTLLLLLTVLFTPLSGCEDTTTTIDTPTANGDDGGGDGGGGDGGGGDGGGGDGGGGDGGGGDGGGGDGGGGDGGGGDGGGGDGGGGDGGGGDGGGGDGGGGEAPYYGHCPQSSEVPIATTELNHLVITEIAPLHAVNRPVWFEIYNPTTAPIALNTVQLRAYAVDIAQEPQPADVKLNPTLFSFTDDMVIASHEHVIVSSALPHAQAPAHTATQHGRILYLKTPGHTFIWQPEAGFLELVDKTSGQTLDFVRFGSDTTEPMTAQAWQGASVPWYTHPDRTTSIGRKVPYQDTQKAQDWSLSLFATIGGRNLMAPMDQGALNLAVSLNTDADKDGIPDDKEVDCAFFNDLPYYAWGARQNQTDMFLQVDFMADNPNVNIVDFHVLEIEVLEASRQFFIDNSPPYINYPMRLHMDAGSTYVASTNANKVDTAKFNLYMDDTNLSGGTTTTFIEKINIVQVKNTSGVAMDPRRRGIFRYLLSAFSDASGSVSTLGFAQQNNQSMTILSNNYLHNDQPTTFTAVKYSTLIHELGHTLGLDHGGSEYLNFKPNYYSVMNYGYHMNMSRPYANYEAEDYDILAEHNKRFCYALKSDMNDFNSIEAVGIEFTYINFSNGSGAPFDPRSFNENNVNLNNTLAPFNIDFNNDNVISSNTSCTNVHTDRNNYLKELKDHDDWSAISQYVFPFYAIPTNLTVVNGWPMATEPPVITCH